MGIIVGIGWFYYYYFCDIVLSFIVCIGLYFKNFVYDLVKFDVC